MASTRNKNDKGNYQSDERSKEDQRLYLNFKHQGNGQAYTNHFAGDGLLMGQMGASNLSYNFCDIDSYLKGIGSTNLVAPIPKIEPQIKPLESLSIMDKVPLLLPERLVIDKNQRPQLF